MTTTTTSSGFSYGVFLSFRGEDTRHTFTDHLNAALKRAGIRTFRDDDAMDRGKRLDPELKKAIHESAISIIVFSRNYASSKWCLDEVVTIIQEQERLSSKHEVVPVFYHVDPTDVKNQTGSFKKAFKKYDNMTKAKTDPQKKIEWLKKVKAWRVSLKKAGNLTGMVLDKNRSEVEFISKIVNVIRKKLNYNLLYVDKKLVGIKNHVNRIESWLQDPSPEAVILVIHGMGGIGKTTLSKCIFNSNYKEYDDSCFLANIHETSNHHNGLLHLQTQLLSKILRSEKEEVIWNLDEGINEVENALCNKKVLLVLDDITTKEQLLCLLGRQQFYPGSKVIITTRHTGLLTNFNIPPMVHPIEELGLNTSIQLFCMHAFHRDRPTEPYIIYTELIIQHCGGLPLALKVLGSYLNGKTIDLWKVAMRKLDEIPNRDIQKVLQLSCDTLEDEDKELFLHIACFFVGKKEEFVVKLLAECDLYPVVGIQNLKDRCLLSIENGRVMMHQLIKKMGQEVVRRESPKDPGKRSRLWNYQDSYNVLRKNEGTRKVEGLVLDMQKIKGINSTSIVNTINGRKRSFEDFSGCTSFCANKENFKVKAIEKMKNLMLLQLDYATFSGSYKKLPKNLRLLRLHGFPFKSIPSDVPLQKLVVLDLRYSKLEEVWDGFKEIGSLKILNLSYSFGLMKTPNFYGLPSLESLLLKRCISLSQVCKSTRYLDRLVLLDISGCINLKDVPCLPTSLVSLKMDGCSSLGSLGQVQCLDSLSQCSLLTRMDVAGCNLFDNSFPEDWSNLFSLKDLNISWNHITSLPGCVKSLPCLNKLHASNCSNLLSVQDVPKSVRYLSIAHNSSLEILQATPDSFKQITAYGCNKLRAMKGCFKLESIKSVDRKIVRNLGLVSTSENGMRFGLYQQNANAEEVYSVSKVLYEFGIFSTFVSEKTLPCFKYNYKERGSTLSFMVPSHPNGSRTSGLNVCFMCTKNIGRSVPTIKINNKTKALVWIYNPTTMLYPWGDLNNVWLSFWRTDNLLEYGDEIEIIITVEKYLSKIVEEIVECCVNVVYDEDNEEEICEEKKDTYTFCMLNQLSWSDRMHVEISDYVHKRRTYIFTNNCSIRENIEDESIVDWRGPETSSLYGLEYNDFNDEDTNPLNRKS